MIIRYDPEADTLSVLFCVVTVTTKELDEGIAADYDAEGGLVGLEILDAINRFGDASIFHRVMLKGLGPKVPLVAEGTDLGRDNFSSYRVRWVDIGLKSGELCERIYTLTVTKRDLTTCQDPFLK